MKTPLLLTLATLAALGTTAQAQVTPPPAPVAPPPPPAAPMPPAPPKPGKATVTIDVDGHRETREVELSDFQSARILIGKSGKNQHFVIETDGTMTTHAPRKVAWLGVTPDEVPESLRSQLSLPPDRGLLLRSVVPDSPAAKAGLQKDDVLTMLDDQVLLSEQQLHGLLKAKHDGDVIRLAYVRRAQPGTAEVKLGLHELSPGVGNDADDADGSGIGEQISRNVNAVVKNAMKTALSNFDQSKAIVMDKAGKMVKLIGEDLVDTDTALDAVDKAMHRANIDEKTIADTKRLVAEELKHNEHQLEKAQDSLKKAADKLKKAADAQAKAAGSDADTDGDND